MSIFRMMNLFDQADFPEAGCRKFGMPVFLPITGEIYGAVLRSERPVP